MFIEDALQTSVRDCLSLHTLGMTALVLRRVYTFFPSPLLQRPEAG